jgi:predicted acyl esterase
MTLAVVLLSNTSLALDAPGEPPFDETRLWGAAGHSEPGQPVISGTGDSNQGYPPVENFMVEMSDGISLNTDVYYPQDGLDPWPVLLFRTPYGIHDDHIGNLAQLGYACVCQDTRGRFGSEGTEELYRDDGWGPNHTDGLDTVDWILDQVWCDGRIGTIGGSARGITQNMLAGALPDSVRCMSVSVAAANLYEHAAFPGGAFRQYDMEGWLNGLGSGHLIDTLYAHPNDGEWWSWMNPESRHHLETIPTFQYGGWFDLFLQGNIDSFTGLQYGGGEGAAGNQKLLIGPWAHELGAIHVGELQFPDAGGFGTPEALIGSQWEWFDYWIRGTPNGIMETPPIAYYLMGDADDPDGPGNEWRTATEWPPPSQAVAYYLRRGGLLSLIPPTETEPPEAYEYDPQHPVPTRGGGNLFLPNGPYDQNPVLWRSDVLVYQTEILPEPVEITGSVIVNLYASSDRIDTDFTAKLCDVYPDGRAMLICDGILRARHRISMETEDFLIPDEVYSFEIDLWETAIVFNSGHRILVAISSSNYPRFDRNPNTGDPFMQHDTMLVATNTVYHEPDYPSHMLLPVTGTLPSGIADNWEMTPGPGIQLLQQNHPNPASASTTIRFSLDRPGPVRLMVYDAQGRVLRRLIDGRSDGGTQMVVWNGLDGNGRPVPSGIYFYRLDARSGSATRKLILMK